MPITSTTNWFAVCDKCGKQVPITVDKYGNAELPKNRSPIPYDDDSWLFIRDGEKNTPTILCSCCKDNFLMERALKKQLMHCPICGGEAELIDGASYEGYGFQVKCKKCGVGTPIEITPELCVELWNRRPHYE